jgi:parallel beta-helix repeat protein
MQIPIHLPVFVLANPPEKSKKPIRRFWKVQAPLKTLRMVCTKRVNIKREKVMRARTITTMLITALLITARYATAQGSLTPPGAPMETMKTLEQVEPRIDVQTVDGDAYNHHILFQPGSYYLSGNLSVTGATGVLIKEAGVTLDLNGFEISRISESGGFGVFIQGGIDRVTVRNGTIRGFQYGIWCHDDPVYSKACLFEKLAVSGCSDYGIYAGIASRIIDCAAHDNAGSGIYAREGAVLRGCSVYGNQGSYGIFAGDGSTLRDCSANNNDVDYAIATGGGCMLEGCVAHGNHGPQTGSFGIYGGAGSTIIGCTARGNTASTNGSPRWDQGMGIGAGMGSIIKDCTAAQNMGTGFNVGPGSIVSCNAGHLNGYNGDGAGIYVWGSDSRIDGNNVTQNNRGIEVNASGNIIVRNTASGNGSNWEVASGNACLVIQATTTGAISGNAGGGGLGSTNPNANFTY